MPRHDDATPDDRVRRAWVGKLSPHDGPIVLVEYDPHWPKLFEQEAQRIRGLLGERVLGLEHVGSTAVPGLSAKPRIDIDLTVADSGDEPAYLPPLQAAGYVLVIREPEWQQHRVLKGPGTDVNLHVFSPDAPELEKHRRFRDWLRANDADRELYARTKRELAGTTWKYVQLYAEAKTAVVEEILAKASGVS